jgi:predicted branched-subunit amino acid permease
MYQAIIDIFPLSLAVVPWGILCGSLAITVGLTPLQAQLMLLLIFAGATQLAALTMIFNSLKSNSICHLRR